MTSRCTSWLYLNRNFSSGKKLSRGMKKAFSPPAAGKCELGCLIQFWESLHPLFVPLCTGETWLYADHTGYLAKLFSKKHPFCLSSNYILGRRASAWIRKGRTEPRLRVKVRKNAAFSQDWYSLIVLSAPSHPLKDSSILQLPVNYSSQPVFA